MAGVEEKFSREKTKEAVLIFSLVAADSQTQQRIVSTETEAQVVPSESPNN